MGQPVTWAYSLTLEPHGDHTRALVHRIQQGSDTRFLWATEDLPGQLLVGELGTVLQELYQALVELISSHE